ncbi:hypothetical protein AAC387_Pa03g1512 [Persea americana]
MAAGEEKNSDFYAVLGLKKECSQEELRNAYKKLALRWHPDRCSASGNSKFVEEAKKRFQAIQEAYSVLSDADKRFLYDVGAYHSEDDESEMGDFLGEMAMMMSQNKPNGNGEDSFEELQELFEEMFHRDMNGFGSSSQTSNVRYQAPKSSAPACNMSSSSNNNRNCSGMSSAKANGDGFFSSDFSCLDGGRSFCLGAEDGEDSSRGRSKGSRRKQKASSRSSRYVAGGSGLVDAGEKRSNILVAAGGFRATFFASEDAII